MCLFTTAAKAGGKQNPVFQIHILTCFNALFVCYSAAYVVPPSDIRWDDQLVVYLFFNRYHPRPAQRLGLPGQGEWFDSSQGLLTPPPIYKWRERLSASLPPSAHCTFIHLYIEFNRSLLEVFVPNVRVWPSSMPVLCEYCSVDDHVYTIRIV